MKNIFNWMYNFSQNKIFIILAKIKIYRITLLQFYWFMDTCYDILNHFYYNWLEIWSVIANIEILLVNSGISKLFQYTWFGSNKKIRFKPESGLSKVRFIEFHCVIPWRKIFQNLFSIFDFFKWLLKNIIIKFVL